MAKIDGLKEEIGWLKIVFGALVAIDAFRRYVNFPRLWFLQPQQHRHASAAKEASLGISATQGRSRLICG